MEHYYWFLYDQWFPNKKGLVTGVVASGFALCPFFMNIVQTFFVNPNNLQPASDGFFYNPEILENVPYLFLVMGGVVASVLLIGQLLYQESPDVSNQEEQPCNETIDMDETLRKSCRGEEFNELVTNELGLASTSLEELSAIPKEDSANIELNTGENELCVPPKEAIKKKEFYLLSVTCICSFVPFLFANAFYKTYGQTFIQDDKFLSITGSVGGVLHTVSRVLVGFIQDKISYKLTSLLLLGMQTVLLFTLVVTPHGGKVMFFIWICGLFITFPFTFVCIPAIVAEVFGTKHAPEIYGLSFISSTASAFLWPMILRYFITSSGWFGTFCVMATFSFTGVFMAILFPETHRA
ncbi:apicoplast pyruvate carrier 1-like isoform X2 [Tachypleus tridentatus]|uniref:apicoplast pyruvate carrier 1-like isoform X2 n=1 Tax=Tachypleus tridentatus TaxID=6853 RepID=UPI003FD39313